VELGPPAAQHSVERNERVADDRGRQDYGQDVVDRGVCLPGEQMGEGIAASRVPSSGKAVTDESEPNPAVSITIVAHNSAPEIYDALHSVRPAAVSGFAEILVVDNESPDDSVARIEADFPEVRVICAGANRGFAAGCNIAWPHARGRYWLLLNPDATFPPDAVERLVAWMDAHPRVGVASPEISHGAGEPESPCRAYPSVSLVLLELSRLHLLMPRRLRGRVLQGPYAARGDCTDAGWVPGTAMIVRRAAVDEVGLLSEDFFLYGEDIEWCWRMRQAGWGVGACGSVAVSHSHASSAGRSLGSDEASVVMARGIYAACRRLRGPLRALLFALASVAALAIEAHHPRRTKEARSRAGAAGRSWRRVLRGDST
jgi:GT2 family glycosyltransferase